MTQTNALTKTCIELLRASGCLAWRNNTGAMPIESASGKRRYLRFGALGSGDIFAVIPPLGQFASIEIKTGADDVRDTQDDWMTNVENVGGLTVVVRTLDDLIAFLDDALAKPKSRARKVRCAVVRDARSKRTYVIPTGAGAHEAEQIT